NGYEAPTPVTVVTSQSLADTNPRSLFASLVQLPQFEGSITNDTRPPIRLDFSPGTFLNLRGFGASRTLNLIDGVSSAPNVYSGLVNADVLPQLFVQRVDIVTGGASAAYGSDAVSGVVNYVLDKNFTGIKALAQAGLSEYGDNFNYKVGVAGG